EDPWNQAPDDIWLLTRPPEGGPPAPSEVVIGFEAGVPTTLDGTALPAHELILALGNKVGAYGFGRIDMIENRRVGIKSREVYECPGALALIAAHRDLEAICLEREVSHEKARLEARWADLVYDGLWFHPLRVALDAFFATTATAVTGEVRLRFTPGQATAVGRRSPHSLYDEELATYTAADTFRHKDSEGFVRIYGLPSVSWGAKHPWL